MGRRIRWVGLVMVVCFGLVIVQLVNIQFVKAHQLASSPNNPRVAVLKYNNPRGTIYAADGTVLAKSIRATRGPYDYPYHYIRQYPDGPLYAGIVGYDSPLYYGTAGIEEEYNSQLSAHSGGPQNLSQLIFRQSVPLTTDDVTLTVEPSLQQAAWNALTTLPPGVNRDGAVVVLDPATGAVEAMVSNPTFDPNAMVSPNVAAEVFAHGGYVTQDHEGFYPLLPIATGERFAPGSTFKVVTSTAAYNLKPTLANFDYPYQRCQSFPDSNKPLCDESGPCGGTMITMLPASCDPGYGELGVQLGVPILQEQAELFGYNSVPGIDLPGVAPSVYPTLPPGSQALLADSAIRAVQRGGDRPAKRDGCGGHCQPRGRHDTAPDVPDPGFPRQPGRDLLTQTDAPHRHSRGGVRGDKPHEARGAVRYGRRSGLPFLSLRRRKDGHGADQSDPTGDRNVDDRLRPSQRSQGCRRRCRARTVDRLGRCRSGWTDHEGRS